MVRTLLRAVLVIAIVAAVAAFFFGYRMANRDVPETESAVGTAGRAVDVGTARQAGADVAEQVAVGANKAQRFASNAALMAKIKSKIALDDTMDASSINVDTSKGVVTLKGHVESVSQRERALQLARETEGVTSVVDELTIR